MKGRPGVEAEDEDRGPEDVEGASCGGAGS